MTQDRAEWIGDYEEHEDYSFYRVKGVDVDVVGWNDTRRRLLTPKLLKGLESYILNKKVGKKQVESVEKFLEIYFNFRKAFRHRKSRDEYIDLWLELYEQLESIKSIYNDYLNRERSNASHERTRKERKLKMKNQKNECLNEKPLKKERLRKRRYSIGAYTVEVDFKNKQSILLPNSVNRLPINFDTILELNLYVKVARSKEAEFSTFRKKIESAVVGISSLNYGRFSSEKHVQFWQEFTGGLSKCTKHITKFRDWRRKQKAADLVVRPQIDDVLPWES
ncbi:hypothetical protein [Shewanella xiamenensis]|uniref:hypothetical protein n=1 Tax=Shewanella xiamenensis TaxID=332186 RepID=UPI000C12AB98|nr:hypothetical protein [Shewanella xiamenensis]PHY60387.1 hypothetical protein CS023_21005 [Shewanella xiamenensis]